MSTIYRRQGRAREWRVVGGRSRHWRLGVLRVPGEGHSARRRHGWSRVQCRRKLASCCVKAPLRSSRARSSGTVACFSASGPSEKTLTAREEGTALLVSVFGLVLALWDFGKVATTIGGADVGRSREQGREERSRRVRQAGRRENPQRRWWNHWRHQRTAQGKGEGPGGKDSAQDRRVPGRPAARRVAVWKTKRAASDHRPRLVFILVALFVTQRDDRIEDRRASRPAPPEKDADDCGEREGGEDDTRRNLRAE